MKDVVAVYVDLRNSAKGIHERIKICTEILFLPFANIPVPF